MDPFTLTILVLITIPLLGYIFLTFNFDYWKKRGVAGPKPWPLFGNLPNVLLQKQNFQQDIVDIYRQYKGKERFVGVFNLCKPQLLALDPTFVREILIANFKNFNKNEFGEWTNKDRDPILTRNPFLLTGDEWKEKRGEITPALTTNRMKASYPVMLCICSKMTKFIEKEVQNSPKNGIDVKELAAKYTTEVVGNCVYGIEAGAFEGGHCEIRTKGASIIGDSFGSLLYFIILSGLPSIFKMIFKRPFVKKEIELYFTDLMNKSIEFRNQTKTDRIDFLNYLLQLKEKKNLSNLDMAAHTLTFFIDGFETSSVAITNCLRCLAEHKDIQQSLRNEINSAVDVNGEMSYEQLLELPYLDQCFNECLRIYPPAMTMNKVCTKTCQIRANNDKYVTIDKGTVVTLPYYAIHHDPRYYEMPELFDPDRFSPENGGIRKYKDMGVFLPFGDGPRICLGMRFALCQSKVAIATIVRDWELTINPKTKPNFILDSQMFLCVPEGGTWIDFEPVRK